MIDVHFRAFNLRSIPLTGVLQRYAGLSGPTAAFLDFVFTAMTRHDRSLDPKPKAIRTMGEVAASQLQSKKELLYQGTPAAKDPAGRRPPSEWQSAKDIDDFVRSIPEEVLMHETATKIPDDNREAVAVIGEVPKDIEGRRDLIRNKLSLPSQSMHALEGAGFPGALAFLGNMLACETTLVEKVRTNTPGAELFVHLMMHMDPSLADDSFYSYSRQIARVRALCANPYVGGRVCAFVAFNAYDPTSLTTVEDALHRGFVGVKFYPPMGYRASGNVATLPWINDVQPAELESRVQALFEMCAELDVPIMTHCTPHGMEADPKGQSGLNSDPNFWRSVLDAHRNLRVCFAHAGDHDGWFRDTPPDKPTRAWKHAIVDLCVRYENVYCDLSHMSEVLAGPGPTPDRGRDALRSALTAILREQPRFAEKIMYGSDFPMPLKAKGWRRFHSRMQSVFDDPSLKPHHAHFFFENARRFLAMGAFLTRCRGAISEREYAWQSRFR